MLWKILFFMILYYSFYKFILFHIIYILCLTHDVMGDYVYEVLGCKEPLVFWQMEQPILFFINYVNVTDVMSLGQMLLALSIHCCHYASWCYYGTIWVSEGSPGPGVVGCYLSSGDLTSSSSHMCGSWYLPMFLFRDGSLTLMNNASLMALAIFWSSLPTMLKLSRDSSWPVMLLWSWMGDGRP